MSDLGSVYDFLNTLGPDGTISYSRGAWLQGAARAGLSFTQAYNQMIGTPLGIRKETALGMWQDIQAVQATDVGISRVPVIGTAGQLLPNEPPPDWTGQYVHTVQATYRTLERDGSYTLETRFYGLKGNNLLSPLEASQYAMGVIEAPVEPDQEINYPDASNVVSLQLAGAYYHTRPGMLGGGNF